jgi:hypothetical protein
VKKSKKSTKRSPSAEPDRAVEAEWVEVPGAAADADTAVPQADAVAATTEADEPATVGEPTAVTAPAVQAAETSKPKGSKPAKKTAASKASKAGNASKPHKAPAVAQAGDDATEPTAARKRHKKERRATEAASGAEDESTPALAPAAPSDAHATGTESATPVEADAVAALADAAAVAPLSEDEVRLPGTSSLPEMPAVIAELATLSVPELVKRHVELLGRKPRIKNRVWLQRKLAWHEQTRRFGGLSGAAKKRLEELIAEVQLPVPTPRAKKATGTPFKSADELPIGTRLERIWHGRVIAATRVENGWRCEGKVHASLSAAAKAVTGGHISGPNFFGLRPRRED